LLLQVCVLGLRNSFFFLAKQFFNLHFGFSFCHDRLRQDNKVIFENLKESVRFTLVEFQKLVLLKRTSAMNSLKFLEKFHEREQVIHSDSTFAFQVKYVEGKLFQVVFALACEFLNLQKEISLVKVSGKIMK
jgi:hypothetical protein